MSLKFASAKPGKAAGVGVASFRVQVPPSAVANWRRDGPEEGEGEAAHQRGEGLSIDVSPPQAAACLQLLLPPAQNH